MTCHSVLLKPRPLIIAIVAFQLSHQKSSQDVGISRLINRFGGNFVQVFFQVVKLFILMINLQPFNIRFLALNYSLKIL